MIQLRCRSSRRTFPASHWLHCGTLLVYSCSLLLVLTVSLAACTAAGAPALGTSTRTPGVTTTPTAAVPTISTPLVSYKGHSDNVDMVAWSPDSQRLASASDDGTLQVWEATTGRLFWKAAPARYVLRCRLVPRRQMDRRR